MAPGDGDADDALAATIAPGSMLPAAGARVSAPPAVDPALASAHTLAAPSGAASVRPAGARGASDMEAGETISAPGTEIGALPPPPTIAPGTCRGEREIARGGMGRIVAAEDQRLRRPVALKELLEPSPD